MSVRLLFAHVFVFYMFFSRWDVKKEDPSPSKRGADSLQTATRMFALTIWQPAGGTVLHFAHSSTVSDLISCKLQKCGSHVLHLTINHFHTLDRKQTSLATNQIAKSQFAWNIEFVRFRLGFAHSPRAKMRVECTMEYLKMQDFLKTRPSTFVSENLRFSLIKIILGLRLIWSSTVSVHCRAHYL